MIEVIVTIFAMTLIVIIVIGMVWSSIQDTLASFEELVINYQTIINQRLTRIEQAHSDGVVEGGVLPDTLSLPRIPKEPVSKESWDDWLKESITKEDDPVTDSVDRVVKLPKVGYPQTHPITYPVRTDVVVENVEGYEPVHVDVVPAVAVTAVTGDGEEIPLEPGDVMGVDRGELCDCCWGNKTVGGGSFGLDPVPCPKCDGKGRLDGTQG